MNLTHHFNLLRSETAPALYFTDSNGENQVYSYKQYFEESTSLASELHKNGFQREQICAFRAPNTPKIVLHLLACFQGGIVAMPLSQRFPQAMVDELVYCANARLCDITTLPTYSSPEERKLVKIDWHFEENQAATILCSSGSTSVPKMFLHTVQNHVLSALGSGRNIPFGEGDCWLQSLPLYHVGGYAIFFRALVGKAAIALPDYTSFNVEAFTRSLEQFPITHCSLVATQLYHCLRSEQAIERLAGLRAILLGGSAIPESLIEQALKHGLKIFTSYGCTEMASQITTTKSPEREHLRTSGNILRHRELCISEEGEILVRGGTLAQGRLTEQGMTSITDDEGWYHTGDVGELDSRKRLIVRGRRDNMFISGGENIHPETIEQTLLERNDIVQAIIVPVPHEIYGFRPVAFLQRFNNLPFDAGFLNELRVLLEQKLPRFAVPDNFFSFPEDIFQTGIKPSRHALRSIAETIVSATTK